MADFTSFFANMKNGKIIENAERIEALNAQILALEDPERFFSIISKAKSMEELGRAYNVSVEQAKAMGKIPIKWIGDKNVLNRLRKEREVLSI